MKTEENDCLSVKCWEKVRQKCQIRVDQLGNPVCSAVTCSHDHLVAIFDSELFPNNKLKQPWSVSDYLATPTFDENLKKWTLYCKIGDCNMQVSAGDEISFTVNSRFVGDQLKVNEGNIIALGDLWSTISITCFYNSDVKIKSNEFDVSIREAEASAFGYGSFNGGFGLRLFSDENFSKPLLTSYIGQTVFVSVDWETKMNLGFLITDCQIGGAKIIQGNCYSKALSVKLLNKKSEKIVRNSSRFSFAAFTTQQKMNISELSPMTVQCQE